jgi:hypothetical protein
MLPMYQEWNLQAKHSLKGLYSIVNKFWFDCWEDAGKILN